MVVREVPNATCAGQRRSFIRDVRKLSEQAYKPQLILDLSNTEQLRPETIDLLLDTVEHVERADGRVAVATGRPENAVILELTRLNSVLDMFSTVSEAMGGEAEPRVEPFDASRAMAA